MNETGPSARRGRPRAFDRDEALRQAMRVFQANGYEGTSMAQLVGALGIVSPSIYAAFGSKEDLFREAVGLYLSLEVEPIWAALDEMVDLQQAVESMLLASIDRFAATGEPHGCLVMLGTGLLGGAEESVRTFLRQRRQGFKDRLLRRLTRGVEDGDLPGDSDPGTLAECTLAFFGGLAIEAVDGTDGAVLRKSAQLFCERLFNRKIV